MELDPEVHAHPHGIGHRKIDLALALSAVVLSIGSTVIAVQNEAAMKRLVTANSWPYVEMFHGNYRDGEQAIHFDLRNAGIGPARIEKFVVSYDGQPVHNHQELLERCCALAKGANPRVMINTVSQLVLTPREVLTFLDISKNGLDDASFERMDHERMKVDMHVCYSSVFDEHWITSLRNPKPKQVDSCDALKEPEYEPHLYEDSK
jgi:hypothetical protein